MDEEEEGEHRSKVVGGLKIGSPQGVEILLPRSGVRLDPRLRQWPQNRNCTALKFAPFPHGVSSFRGP